MADYSCFKDQVVVITGNLVVMFSFFWRYTDTEGHHASIA